MENQSAMIYNYSPKLYNLYEIPKLYNNMNQKCSKILRDMIDRFHS